MKNHIIITGTGRSGTTFLMQLLTALKLDTGFHDINDDIHDNSCGMERGIGEINEETPYIVKSPYFCLTLNKINNYTIDHIFVPIRDLDDAAESRIRVSKDNIDAPGSLWGTKDPTKQKEFLLNAIYQLILSSTQLDIPITFLSFPRIVIDPEYLYNKLMILKLDKEKFYEAFRKTSRPGLIHFWG